jgi:hypothetical protein
VRLALWLAFLIGGVPVERDLAPALKTLTFLDRDPDSMTGTRDRIPLDLNLVIRWLEDNQQDGGIISWLPPDSHAARYLDLVSGGQFHDWLRRFTVLRQTAHISPSHD